jgi:endonuclease/exonuclease/phosphatase family metal-dependent hydrolase
VLYRSDRFDPIESGNFWLSDTPDVEASLGWDAPDPRICTWVVLRDQETDRRFVFLNTHLDRWGTKARTASVELIVSKLIELGRYPSIVAADLNSREHGEPYAVFKQAMLRDSFRDFSSGPAPPTMHHYGERLGPKIDFVFCDPNWRVLDARVVEDKPLGRWPSDHYPVTADLELLDELPSTSPSTAGDASARRRAGPR